MGNRFKKIIFIIGILLLIAEGFFVHIKFSKPNYKKDILNFLNGKSIKNIHEDTIKRYEYAYMDDGKNVKITLLMNDYIKYITTLAIEKYEGKESGIEKREQVKGKIGGPGLSGIDYYWLKLDKRIKENIKDGFDIEVVKDRYKSRGFNKEEMELVEKGEFSEKFKEEILKDKRIQYEDGEYWIKGLTEEMVIALPHHLNMEGGETVLYKMECKSKKIKKKYVIEGKKFTKCEIIDYGSKSGIMDAIIYQDDNKITRSVIIKEGKIDLSLTDAISNPSISIKYESPQARLDEVYENVSEGYGTEEENEWVYEQNRKARERLAEIDKKMMEETPEMFLFGRLPQEESLLLATLCGEKDELVKNMTKKWGRGEITLEEFREEFKEYIINGLNETVKKKHLELVNKYLEKVNDK